MAVAYLEAAFAAGPPPGLALLTDHADTAGTVARLAHLGLASPLTSSAGRLFDAVSALVTRRDAINYEGQAAVELEAVMDLADLSYHDVPLLEGDGGTFVMDGVHLFGLLAEDLASGGAPPALAARFHNSLARAVVVACERAREMTGLGRVALSGGVFQNQVLAERAAAGLRSAGFSVLTHRRVPTNDGGVSLGQAVVAAARDREGR